MSDIADRADGLIEAIVTRARREVACAPSMVPDGRCRFCDEVVPHPGVFCDTDCRDDYEKEQAALRRAGTIR